MLTLTLNPGPNEFQLQCGVVCCVVLWFEGQHSCDDTGHFFGLFGRAVFRNSFLHVQKRTFATTLKIEEELSLE
jgi:hypothetical protein